MIKRTNQQKNNWAVYRQRKSQQFWIQLNQFRKNPQILKSRLEQRKWYYNEDNLLFSSFHVNKSIKTMEGKNSINQLIGEVINERLLEPIQQNEQLSEAAVEIAQMYRSCDRNRIHFTPSYVLNVRQKLNNSSRYQYPHAISCLIAISFDEQFESLLTLLIDDGDIQRKNRKILFSNLFKFGGACSLNLQSDQSLVCVVLLLTKQIFKKQISKQSMINKLSDV